MHASDLDTLNAEIQNCSAFEGRYELNCLYEDLSTSTQNTARRNNIARTLIRLIALIKIISNANTNQEDRLKAIVKIPSIYSSLAIEAGINGIFFKCQQSLLNLGGFILGLISGILGSVIGFFSMAIKNLKNYQLPTSVFVGAFTGLFVGFTIGQRVPEKLFKGSKTLSIQHSIRRLEDTFKSLYLSTTKNYNEEIKQEILENVFKNNETLLKQFLEKEQKYHLLSIAAPFFSDELRGSLGHHLFIKIEIPPPPETPGTHHFFLEMGQPSDKEKKFSQTEERTTTGENLIKMIAMHRILHPTYELSLSNIVNFSRLYIAGVNDCHTYINKILLATGQDVSNLKRFTPKDTFFGRSIGSALNFFNPLSKKATKNGLRARTDASLITTPCTV